MPIAPAAALAGALFGASLIVAFGAQNTFVLRQGLLRAHVPLVVAICALSDVVLIAVGVAGAGVALRGWPTALEGVRIAGAAALLAFGAVAARRAWRPPAPTAGGRARDLSATGVAGACLAFTWLNPAVYLDTIVLLGSVAATHAHQRWSFGAGAAVASAGWFAALGFGARVLGPLFQRPLAWRALDAFVAIVMLITAVRLATGA